jgi:hypothetical protein
MRGLTPWRAGRSASPSHPGAPCFHCGKTNTPGTFVMSTPEPFVYRLKALAKVVDGDTLDLDLDLGFGASSNVSCLRTPGQSTIPGRRW